MLQLVGMRDQTSTHELQSLQADHREIVRLASLGLSNEEIAEELGCTTLKVRYTLNSSLGRDQMVAIQQQRDTETIDIADRIQRVAGQAIQVLEQLLSSRETSPKEKISIATDVLDRAGHAPVKQIAVDNYHSYAERAGMDRIGQRMKILEAEKVIKMQPVSDGTSEDDHQSSSSITYQPADGVQH